MQGNFDALNLLLEYGADVNQRNEFNVSVIDEIVRQDNVDLFKCVFKTEDLQRPQGVHGHIHHAAGYEEDSKCLKLLLAIGQSPNQISNSVDLATPLHFAALTGSIGNALLLIKAGANVNSKDNMGNTPMHLAIM